MNREEFEALPAVRVPSTTVSVADVHEFWRERTLLYGYTVERDTWHVYVKDGRIHRHVYRLRNGEAQTLYGGGGVSSPAELLVPDKRLYPERCDFQFCKTLLNLGIVLPFTSWGAAGEKSAVEPFHGALLPSVVRA